TFSFPLSSCFFSLYCDHPPLHSFPTRRSSDLPVVPSQGSVGASGDLAPLSHLFLPLIGLGKVEYQGKTIPTQDLFDQTGFQPLRSEEHTSELQSRENLVCRLLLEKKKKKHNKL